MTKKRLKLWLTERAGDSALRDSILSDRRAISKRLSEKEVELLLDLFDAVGCVDLYGRLEEYLQVILTYVVDSRSLIDVLQERMEAINKYSRGVHSSSRKL